MTKVLIVYENIPETTQLFLVDANDVEVEFLKKAHEKYINVEDDDGLLDLLNAISYRLADPSKEWAFSGVEELAERIPLQLDKSDVGKWFDKEIKVENGFAPEDGKIDLVVITGCVM